MMEKTRLLHIITGLSIGGAEMMLYKLLSNIDREKFDIQVISLTDIGPIGKKIQHLGIQVEAVGMRRGVKGLISVNSFFKLQALLRKYNPDVVQTWMYHADLIGGLATKIAVNAPVVWNIRHSNLAPNINKKTTIWAAKACARFSKFVPKKIICCSEASKRVHIDLGYDESKMIVIPNGFDIEKFKPDTEARKKLLNELQIPENSFLIGLVARFDPQKDHHTFIRAAKILSKEHPNVHYILCGEGVTWGNKELADWIKDVNLQDRFHLLGRREDIPKIMASLDVLSSSSCGEGFPNVIGEAMACGVPCVVTDVGDSAYVVGDTGIVVPPKNPGELAKGLKKVIDTNEIKRKQIGLMARNRIMQLFEIHRIVKKYETLYEELCAE
jgi:glycosyltransferase involved in cell wall biosynthesis